MVEGEGGGGGERISGRKVERTHKQEDRISYIFIFFFSSLL